MSTPKTLNRKGSKIKRSKPKMIKGQRVRVDDASDNSSLCANSDLSNISDESLPSDMEEVEVRVWDSTSQIFLLLTCILGASFRVILSPDLLN